MGNRKNDTPFDILFDELEDTRKARLIRYPLNEVLFLVLVGTLCGCDKLTMISVFGEEKIAWFRKYYDYKNGIPSHDTIGRVLSSINKRDFERLFINWVSSHFEIPEGTLVHIDGKHISGSANNHDKIKKRADGGRFSEIIVNVYASAVGIALGHHNVSESLNEMKGALELLECLDLPGSCVTGDSNFCRQKIVDKIIAKKGNYLFALKKNSRNLFDAVQHTFSKQELDTTTFETKENGHGRKEHRIYRALSKDQLPIASQDYFTKIEYVIEVTRHRHIIRSAKETTDTHYYVTNLKEPIADIGSKIRDHWLIENQLHYVLDVLFGEDASRVRQKNGATNLSLIRKMSLNLIKSNSLKGSIKHQQLRCAISDEQREKILRI